MAKNYIPSDWEDVFLSPEVVASRNALRSPNPIELTEMKLKEAAEIHQTSFRRKEELTFETCSRCGSNLLNQVFDNTLSWQEFCISCTCQKCQSEIWK